MATYYVDNSGLDSNIGSLASPFKTAQKASSVVAAGDTVIFNTTVALGGTGTYTGPLNTIDGNLVTIASGTNLTTGAITFRSAIGTTAILMPGAASVSGNIIDLPSQQYIIFDGLIADGTGTSSLAGGFFGGIYCGPTAQNIVFQNGRIRYCPGQGANNSASSSGNLQLLNNKIHDNGHSGSPQTHNVYLPSSNNTVTGNEIYNGAYFGVTVYDAASNPSGNIVKNNYIHDNCRFGASEVGVGGGGSANQIIQNIIAGASSGYAIQVEFGGATIGTLIYNNTVTLDGGIRIGPAASGTLVKNNVLRNTANTAACAIDDAGSGSVFSNNTTTADPLLIDLPAQDFHIEITSPAINAGNNAVAPATDFDGLPRPNGTTNVSTGAFEYTATPAPPPPIPSPPQYASAGLVRSGSYFNPATNWSIVLWANLPVVSGADYNSLYLFGDPTFAHAEIQIWCDVNGLHIDVYDGIATTSSIGPIVIDKLIWRAIAVTYDSSTHTVTAYVNGVSAGTVVVNISTITFTETTEIAFTDASASPQLAIGLEMFNIRTWQRKLTQAQIDSENFVSSAALATNLLSDTPLDDNSDLTDNSGNGHNWTNTTIPGISTTTPTLVTSPPTNLTSLLAYDIGTLPKTVIQNVRNVTDQTVWYTFLTSALNPSWGVFNYGQTSGYRPITTPYYGTAASPISVLGLDVPPFPFEVVGFTSTRYFLKSVAADNTKNPAYSVINVIEGPNGDYQNGDMFITPDTLQDPALPATIVDLNIDYTVRKFIPFMPTGEAGDGLPGGILLLESTETGNTKIRLYNSNFNLLSSIDSGTTNSVVIRRCTSKNNFIVGINTTPPSVKTISAAGVAGTPHILTAVNPTVIGIATNQAQTKLYFSNNVDASPIKTCDLVGDVAGANFQAGIANYRFGDILVLPNDDVIAVSYHPANTRNYNIYRWNSAGTLQATYVGTTYALGTPPRLGYSLDLSTTFFLYQNNETATIRNGVALLIKLNTLDMSIVFTRTVIVFDNAIYTSHAAENSTPITRFGPDTSCPIIVLNTTSGPTSKSGIYFLDPGKRNDTLWIDTTLNTTEDVKIP